jgi:predicted Rdx family selenoprotein
VAAELKKELGIDAKLVRGGGGIFDVKANGKLVYTKSKTFNFPQDGEVVRLIRTG